MWSSASIVNLPVQARFYSYMIYKPVWLTYASLTLFS